MSRLTRKFHFENLEFMKRLLIFLLVLVPIFVPAQTSEVSEETLRREAFEKVWRTINEKHYDETFGGVDWQKIREIYEPKAMKAQSRTEFHKILNQMLSELKVSHIGVYEVNFAELLAKGAAGVIGAEIKIVEEKPVIWRVEKGSSAEKAGLRSGFIIEKIDGRSVNEIFNAIEGYLAEMRANDRVRKFYKEKVLNAYVEGKPETKVVLEVIDEQGSLRKVEMERYKGNYVMSEPIGNFPPQPVIFESRRINKDVGYIRFNIWTIPQIQKLVSAIGEFADTKGIIFDLRGNPGGIGGIASRLAGLLVKKEISLGKMKGRGLEFDVVAYPQTNSYAGKVVILIDYGTGSTSEIFTIGLQENGRALVIGERSLGAALPSIFETLPTGALFQYAIMDYKSPKGTLVEGNGVKPDMEVLQTRQSLLEGKDLPLEIAVQQILKNK